LIALREAAAWSLELFMLAQLARRWQSALIV
jgi:hypothetical protein